MASAPRELYGRDIRFVAKSVLQEFPSLSLGHYAKWTKEDGSFAYEWQRSHSTRAITFSWIDPGDFYAVPMEDEYRGHVYEIRNVQGPRELADFIRGVVMEEAQWLGIDVADHHWKHPRLRPLSDDDARKYNLLAIPPPRA